MKFKILQLCFINNLWPVNYDVTSIDIKTGNDVLELPDNFGKDFDLVIASPPCDQFTKANSLNWIDMPVYFIDVAKKCLSICINSGKYFLFENPPGRIERFMPALNKYRLCTWYGNDSNKEYILYSNYLFLFKCSKRYGKPGTENNLSKTKREAWKPELVNDLIIALTSQSFPAGGTL